MAATPPSCVCGCGRDTVQLRLLDIADHRDRWDRTPFRAKLEDLIQAVLPDFAWVLTPRHG